MPDTQILERIKHLAHSVVPDNGQVILFGSRARGSANNHSDWDILIILDTKNISQEVYNTVVYPFDKIGWELNADINPVVYTKRQWESSSHTLFYKNVTQEGIIL